FFFFQAEAGIRDFHVTGVQTCALPICPLPPQRELARAIKAMMAIAYYEMPAVKRELGYLPEEWIERVKTRRLKVYADEIRRHDESLIAPDPLPPRAAGKGAEPAAAVTPLAARRAPGKAQGGAA